MANISIRHLTEDEQGRLAKEYLPVREQGQVFIRTEPGECILPRAYEKYKHDLFNFKVRDDDVYVLTFPKNGTTWSQEMAWCILNNADVEAAKKTNLFLRSPFLDIHMLDDFVSEQHNTVSGMVNLTTPFGAIGQMESPRVLKSHLPFCLLNDDMFEKSRVIVCLRNPKDTMVSYFHHEILMKTHGFTGDFQTSFNLFMDGMQLYGSYWKYTCKAWEKRDHRNVCLLFFEDMKQDLEGSLRKVAKFLQKELSDDQVARLIQHLSFDKMKNNKTVNLEAARKTDFSSPTEGRFMRKGQVGDWKNYFTDEMNRRMDEAIDQYFKGIGLHFRYE